MPGGLARAPLPEMLGPWLTWPEITTLQRTARALHSSLLPGPDRPHFAGAQCPKQCHAGAHLFCPSAAPQLPVSAKLSSSNTFGPPKCYPTGKVSANGLLCREFGS